MPPETWNFSAGAIVPIPTLPFCKTVKPDVPATFNPPAKVDVAVEEVAFINFVSIKLLERSAVVETPPAKVVVPVPVYDITPATVSVPVAVIFAAVIFPEKKPFPWTERLVKGEVVPTPTLPLAATTKFVAEGEPIAKVGPVVILFGLIENCAHGEVVPRPTLPFEKTLKN